MYRRDGKLVFSPSDLVTFLQYSPDAEDVEPCTEDVEATGPTEPGPPGTALVPEHT